MTTVGVKGLEILRSFQWFSYKIWLHSRIFRLDEDARFEHNLQIAERGLASASERGVACVCEVGGSQSGVVYKPAGDRQDTTASLRWDRCHSPAQCCHCHPRPRSLWTLQGRCSTLVLSSVPAQLLVYCRADDEIFAGWWLLYLSYN